MSLRDISGEISLLRIFINESDRSHHHALSDELLLMARRSGLAGATTLRAMVGFGERRRWHTDYFAETAINLPLVVEIVDTPERVLAFFAEVEPLLDKAGALVTEERALVRHYNHRDEARSAEEDK